MPSLRLLLKRLALLLLSSTLLWLLYTFVRWRVLLRNGAVIKTQSAHFSRDYFVGDKNKPALTYLVMGDSTAAGWGAGTLQSTYPYQIAQAIASRGYYVHVRNVAIGGATIWDVCRIQLPVVSKTRPDIITLSVGANDATRGTTDGDCIRGLRNLFEAFQNSTARIILVGDIPDMSQIPALPLPLSIKVGKRALRLNVSLYVEAQRAKVRVVKLYDAGKLVYHDTPNLYAADLFHPSAQGYRIWSHLFIKALPQTLNF